MDQVIKLE